jgi:hypothetical protein
MASSKNFRPGQFGIFTVTEKDCDLNNIITQALPGLSHLRLKSVEWVDLGSQIMAMLFSSFRSQIYLSEWQAIFNRNFPNTLNCDQLRENSKRVVKIIAETRHTNALSIHQFQVMVN